MASHFKLHEPVSAAAVQGIPTLPILDDLTESARNTLAQNIVSDFSRWKEARAPLEATWRECWEAYLCDMGSLYAQAEDGAPDRSRVVRPVLYEAVESLHANLLNSLFPAGERFFSVHGKTEADHQKASVIEEFLRTKLQDMCFIERYGRFLKQAIITGNTVAAVPWRRERAKRRQTEPITLFGVTVGHRRVVVDELVANGPSFEVLDMFDFLIDPDAVDFQQAKVIRRLKRPLDALRANPAYGNLEGLTPDGAASPEADSAKAARRQAFGIQEGSLQGSGGREGLVTLLEAWGDFRIDGVVYQNYVCTVAAGSRVIRFEPNPYDCGEKPFVFTTFIPVPNEVYGIGAIEKSLGLQHAINTLTNQKLDVINISINSPFTYLVNDDVFDPNNLVTRPGALIPVKSHDTLKPVQYLNNFTVAFSEIADLKNELQEATGALKYFTGASSGGSERTATEVSALVQGGAQKFSSVINHLEQTSLEPFLQVIFAQAKQFLREPEMLRVARNDGSMEFVRILPDLLRQAQCAFRIDGSQAAVLKGRELEALVTFLKLVNGNDALARQVNVMELYKRIYRRLGFRDEEQIFLPVPGPTTEEERP
jgi:hypothetical protein